MMTDSQKAIERVNFVYRSGSGDNSHDVELPFRVLVIGQFSTQNNDLYNIRPITVTEQSIDDVIKSFNIALELNIKNRLLDNSDDIIYLKLPIRSLQDFTPDGIVDNVPGIKDLNQVRLLLKYLSDSGIDKDIAISYIDNLANKEVVIQYLDENGININLLDRMSHHVPMTILADLDRRISEQLDEIFHSDQFMHLESSWRSLKFLLESFVSNQNCTVELLCISKEALIEDFEDVPEITHSKFYDIVYSSEFGQFGGRPYGVIVGDYEFSPSARDMKLAQQISIVASKAHAPFISGAHSSMFDIDNISDLPRVRDFSAIYDQLKYSKWNEFRNSNEARYFALTVPRFKLRDTYGINDVNNSIGYRESIAGGLTQGIWGNSAYAFTTRLIDSFVRYRWCINITGIDDGKVNGINMSSYEGAVNAGRIPTQVLISDRQLHEITSQGFIPLSVHKSSNIVAFFASNSVIRNKSFTNDQKGKEASLSYHLGSQLQYLFITCRIAHYLKMMQREHIGTWRNKSEVERELNEWIRQYVSDMDNPTSTIRAKRPLRRAKVLVDDIPTQNDLYIIQILVTPHLKYMGTTFVLEETGKLEKH